MEWQLLLVGEGALALASARWSGFKWNDGERTALTSFHLWMLSSVCGFTHGHFFWIRVMIRHQIYGKCWRLYGSKSASWS